MAYPELALHDPMYWMALIILLATPVLLVMRSRSPVIRSRTPTIVLVLLLAFCLLSGCYALLGTACYVGGGCP
mgnify:CR=1 FL=1